MSNKPRSPGRTPVYRVPRKQWCIWVTEELATLVDAWRTEKKLTRVEFFEAAAKKLMRGKR